MHKLIIKLACDMFPSSMITLPSFESLPLEYFHFNEDIEMFLLNELTQVSEVLDINLTLKLLKKANSTLTNSFIDSTLEFYFTHPDVLSIIQNDRKTLFPNARVLKDINYDLLIPVFERG